MSKYTGTKTEKNLLAAFAGESQARNKYTYFSQIAKDEGNDKIIVPVDYTGWRLLSVKMIDVS